MTRQETIDAIVEASRRRPLPVVKSYSGSGKFALLSSEGTTVGTACDTEEECAQRQADAIQHGCDKFRKELDKMTDTEIEKQAAYWLRRPQGATATPTTKPTPNTMTKTTVKLTKTKDCRGSVRFDAPKTPTPNAIENVYVSRSVAGINEAKEITVTIEVP